MGLGLIAVLSVVWLAWPLTAASIDSVLKTFRGTADPGHDHSGHEQEHAHDAGGEHAHGEQVHAGHEHGDAADANSLELSPQARNNIGLTPQMLQPVRLTTYRRSIGLPAIVVERPGRTILKVATPMTGVVTHVHAVTGEAVEPGALLFEIRLTHEDLVQAQTDFLKTIGELAVERREVERLTEAAASGAVARIKLLERRYAVEKLEAIQAAQKEALRLHGLSDRQVDQIEQSRRLLRELQIVAPYPDQHSESELQLTLRPVSTRQPAAEEPSLSHPLIISELNVHKGQAIEAGTTLCVLSDLEKLYIEGLAFEQDAPLIEKAAEQDWELEAVTRADRRSAETIPGLSLAFINNEISREDRVLKFYVELPNRVVRSSQVDGQRFTIWKFKPGQRMELRIPIEEWPDRIVLPVDAVAREGAEFYVFLKNGSSFDRHPVHVEYRDQYNVVIANDGAIFPGDIVAMTGAHQMQIALKNLSSPVDYHGHTH